MKRLLVCGLLLSSACSRDTAPVSERMVQFKEERAAAAKAYEGNAELYSGQKGLSNFGQRTGSGADRFAAIRAPSTPAPLQLAARDKTMQEGDNKSRENDQVAPTATRAWFPETFLFEPLVVTDTSGKAEVAVTVPDRLTNWRVLALAHSRDGAQAGSVASFEGTLPVYVDPVVPPFLVVGDEVRVPIQLVNTTDAEVQLKLDLETTGAQTVGSPRNSRLSAEGSVTEYATLRANQPGTVTFRAGLEGYDAVVRQIPVVPAGQRLDERRGGTLASTRELDISLPEDVSSLGAHARLEVFPGALALLRSELSAASDRVSPADDAYALVLAGRGPELLRQLGDTPDEKAMRALRLLATQRALRDAQTNDPMIEAAFLEAGSAHPQDEVLSRMVKWLGERVASAQRPDGSFGGANGWTVQRLFVASAECVHALQAVARSEAEKQRATRASLRAQGFFERQLSQVKDGYTAASLIVSGVLPQTSVERLRQIVRESISSSALDGGPLPSIPHHIVRADGTAPSGIDAAATAVLALDPQVDAALRAELGTTILAGYRSGSGWGDARTNLIALRAAVELFKEPLPGNVQVDLLMDGQLEAHGMLDPQHVRDVVALDVPVAGVAGRHHWTVKADPPVPGLGFTLTVTGYGAWKVGAADGLELETSIPRRANVGQLAAIDVTAKAPLGIALRIRQALPAGVQVHRPSLEALVQDHVITSFQIADGSVELEVPPRSESDTFTARWLAIPTLSGTLHAAAAEVEAIGHPGRVAFAAPAVWNIH